MSYLAVFFKKEFKCNVLKKGLFSVFLIDRFHNHAENGEIMVSGGGLKRLLKALD